MVQVNRTAGKTEKWSYVGKRPLTSTRSDASLGTMWPRSEKYPCPENRTRFSLDRFRSRLNLVGPPLCRRRILRTYKPSLQSYRLEFMPILRQQDNPLAYNLLMIMGADPQQREPI